MSKKKHRAMNHVAARPTPHRAPVREPAPARTETPATGRRQTIEQRRAAHAWQTIQEVRAVEGAAADFAGHAKKLPMRIRAAGLGQALAFVAAKGKLGTPGDVKPGPRQLLADLGGWVLDERGLRGDSKPNDPQALIREIQNRDAAFLKRATLEAMGWLAWVNRFAEAEGLRGHDD